MYMSVYVYAGLVCRRRRLGHILMYMSVYVYAGLVTTLAGSVNFTYADGVGSAASFNHPSGVAVDSSGALSDICYEYTFL